MTVFLRRRVERLSADRVCTVPTADDAVLQQAWSALRRAHPVIPDAEIRAVPGRRGSADTSIDWTDSKPLILVGARTIEGGREEVLNFLLHQAAHGATPGGGVTSGLHGRWHTDVFKGHAESFGLVVSGSARSITTMADWGKQRYAEILDLLGRLYT